MASLNNNASKISVHPDSDDPETSHHLVFFITGNPGLIAYYDTFLKTLHSLLAVSFKGSKDVFHIHGQSLAGFEDDENPPLKKPYSLEEQITYSLSTLAAQTVPSGPQQGQPYNNIILIGHSVGSYILLEIIQRLRRSESLIDVEAGILLFPTVTHIAASPSGVKISTLFRLPEFPKGMSLVAKGLIALTPESVLRWLVGIVTRMPEDAAEVTTRFLKSRMGVWQALHMARDEMEMITEDRWDEDIWGIEHEDEGEDRHDIPKLIFYFGQNDHWVADHTRDALIAARGREPDSKSSKPIMLIDENGVDHGFCIRHSESIAEKVAIWIEDIIKEKT